MVVHCLQAKNSKTSSFFVCKNKKFTVLFNLIQVVESYECDLKVPNLPASINNKAVATILGKAVKSLFIHLLSLFKVGGELRRRDDNYTKETREIGSPLPL
jgi:hypothetical protein